MAEHAVTTKLVSPDRKREFSWAIDNVSKFSRRLYSSSFSVGRECEHRFQMVARLSQAHPDAHVSSVSIGFMRTDSLHGHATVSCEVQLFNSEGDRYCHKECRWYISKSESRFACSEMFSDYPEKLVLPGVKKNISFKDDHEMICLKGKRLVGSYGDFNKIFILPKDKLIVMGHIKIFGCCPTLVEVSDAKERKRLQPDVDQLLLDFRQAYENEIMTDVELVVGERIIKAHKLVLFSRSPVFRSMFEYNTSEKKDSVIYMDDINSDVMEALVWYLYTATVRDLPYQDVCDLYEAADKYIVPTLQKACFEILMSSIEIPLCAGSWFWRIYTMTTSSRTKPFTSFFEILPKLK
ncbi:TD and POZ domain-containing protein 2 [Caerostris extrusa]|uniref:TD and POZ domain-containing protein 2 n=1 Tax=Caerostris extrusa TaxID=172846 RepID=A0AAV4U220_CAEEX|nr:TD and POZ domain-containing protein 2 [Caerostris extrusa]